MFHDIDARCDEHLALGCILLQLLSKSMQIGQEEQWKKGKGMKVVSNNQLRSLSPFRSVAKMTQLRTARADASHCATNRLGPPG